MANVHINVRCPKSVRSRAASLGRKQGESLNEWVVKWIRAGIESDTRDINIGDSLRAERALHHHD